MFDSALVDSLVGGALIGAGGAALLFTHGRVAGISGIVGGLLTPSTPDRSWRVAFVVGLIAVGLVFTALTPAAMAGSPRALPLVVLARLLVGYGTRLGSGCTSGHGVCGIGRASPRSLAAVATFMTTGGLTASLLGAP